MRKTWLVFRREFKAAVQTRSFIIGLIIAPVFMGGSGIAMALFENRTNAGEQWMAVLDRSGAVAGGLVAAAAQRNENELLNAEGEQVKPTYVFEILDPSDEDLDSVRLELSNLIRNRMLHAYIEIGPGVLEPTRDWQAATVEYHAANATLDETRRWVQRHVNRVLQEQRLELRGVPDADKQDVLAWISATPMGLVSVSESGAVVPAESSGELEIILIPIISVMLMFMLMMMGGMPLLHAVMEEKSSRVSEVMLSSVSPFELMMGKILGGVGVGVTGLLFYTVVGYVLLSNFGLLDMVPFEVLPWFYVFNLLSIFMVGALMAAVGSACNDAREAQTMTFPVMIPLMIPMFVMIPVLTEPLGTMSTIMSLIPLFTPMLMVLRLASPVEIPLWQPYAGLLGVMLLTIFIVWTGGRVFRVGILMQGTPPKLSNLVRWAIRG